MNTGTWKVHNVAAGGSQLPTVSAAFNAPTLVLTASGGDLAAAGTYYVSVTEEGKPKSGRLALIVYVASELTNEVTIIGTAVAGAFLAADASALGGSGVIPYQ
ncbi:MAG: hypothetical protein MdMp014T_0213 [Treponematales bacterium]